MGSEAVPDATTLLKFWHLLEAHDLTRQIFAEMGALLSERKLLMKEGALPAPSGAALRAWCTA